MIDQLIDSAEEILGDLRPHILWEEAATPMTQTRYTLSTDGSSYGIELATDQFGPLRPDFKTAIDGLFLAGASTRRGHGIVGAMNGGVEAASAVLGRNLREEVEAGRGLRRHRRPDRRAARAGTRSRPAASFRTRRPGR